jgi:RNA polymerase sigma factor (sigma-70 family)
VLGEREPEAFTHRTHLVHVLSFDRCYSLPVRVPGDKLARGGRATKVRTAGNVRLTSKFIGPKLGGAVPPQLSSPPGIKRSLRSPAEEAEVLEALHAAGAYGAISLDAPRSNGDDGADETLGDTLSVDDDRFDRAEDRATLARLARRIAPREREVLRLRFAEELAQAEIGERIGLSQIQVSRIIRQALTRLQVSAGAHK